MAIDYDNLRTNINTIDGGSTTVTISATNAGQGNNIPCRFCRLQSRTGNGLIRVRINMACGASDGMALPSYPTITPYPVSNVNKLYFYGETPTNIIDIEYFK